MKTGTIVLMLIYLTAVVILFFLLSDTTLDRPASNLTIRELIYVIFIGTSFANLILGRK